jgi:hypothetical protein
MASALQPRSPLHVAFVRGNDYSAALDFSVATTGYTWAAEIYSLNTGEILATPTVTTVDAALGKVSLAVPRTTGNTLPIGTLGLRIRWTAAGGVRDVLGGTCEVLR